MHFHDCSENERDSTSKSPGATHSHTHFFPQSDKAESNSDIGMDDMDQPRRMYVREEFTHENTVRGHLHESDGSIKR